ncbi:Rv0361 family membrane protein [Dactylosporangium darangshiense]|uniref:Ig-like domain-containing protein n=1 Tax=Dactylosporangium darangshiense TaxID=579108 RepID=A0ABP8D3Y0_9ACTN
MTQPPQYPGQPEYQGQPGQPGQGWPPPPVQDPYAAPPAQEYTVQSPVPPDPYAIPQQSQDPYAVPQQGQDPYAVPPTSAPPTSGQPYAAPYGPPTGQVPPTGAFGQPTGQFPPPTGQFPTGPMPTGQFPQPAMAPPFSGPPAPVSGMPVSGYPVYPQQAPPKKKRGLMITLIVLGVVVVLCGGGGAAAYYVVQNNQGTGATSAVDAVNNFLTAVYKDKNSDEALKYVCASSRNKDKLAARVDEIRRYDASLSSPTYTWPTPTVEKQEKDQATLNVAIKVSTSDEKVAETKYKYIATNSKGWWVCEITAA